MIRRVISGGQTGVDRAALDAALELDVLGGGWCPKGRIAEDGPLDPRYPLQETPGADYEERTRWNVRDGDATIVLGWGEPEGGTAYTMQVAEELGVPYCLVDLKIGASVEDVIDWLEDWDARCVNVAGPRASKAPEVYAAARAFMTELLLAGQRREAHTPEPE